MLRLYWGAKYCHNRPFIGYSHAWMMILIQIRVLKRVRPFSENFKSGQDGKGRCPDTSRRFLVRFHFEWVNTQNMKIIEYQISKEISELPHSRTLELPSPSLHRLDIQSFYPLDLRRNRIYSLSFIPSCASSLTLRSVQTPCPFSSSRSMRDRGVRFPS